MKSCLECRYFNFTRGAPDYSETTEGWQQAHGIVSDAEQIMTRLEKHLNQRKGA